MSSRLTVPALAPHHEESERAALGAALQSHEAAAALVWTLRPSDFFHSRNSIIFEAINTVLLAGGHADLVTVPNLLEERGQLREVGGLYLSNLVDQTPTPSHFADYIRTVKMKAIRRRVADELARAAVKVRTNGTDPAAELADLWERLRDVESPATTDPRQGVLMTLGDVLPQPVTWLWKGHIARGKLNITVGDPGTGKSFHACDVTARTSTGACWPDGAPGTAGDVVWLTAEDGLADTMRPRLDALGADVSRIHFLLGVGDPEKPAGFDLGSDVRILENVIAERRAALVVIDPLSAYLGEIDSHRDADVRGVLAPLAAMAERTNVAILGIMHLNKSQQQRALYRATGALAFVAAARSVFAVVEDQEDKGRRLYVALKMNVAPKPPTLSFRLDGGTVRWEQGTREIDAETALGGWEAKAEQGEREEAIRFLRDAMVNGSVRADDLKREAKVAGISDATLRRAKSELGVKSYKVGYPGIWMWTLFDTPSEDAHPLPHSI